MTKFSLPYFILAIIFFTTEVLIAAFMHDAFIRPTFGDFLVVILMYCGLRSVLQANYRYVAIATLLTAYAIEIAQYFHLIVHVGLQHSTLAKCILGCGFSWGDMLAYTLGVALIWMIESRRESKRLAISN